MKHATKKLITLCLAFTLFSAAGCSGFSATSSTPSQPAPSATTQQTNSTAPIKLHTKILFINASRDPNGNTAKMGADFLQGVDHDTLFLNNYKIYQLGQKYPDDQFKTVMDAIAQADTIVIGSPVYWHTMSGPLKTFIHRLYELDKPVPALKGKKLYFLMQGAAPSQATKEQMPFIMSRVAAQYDMQYMGAATAMNDLSALQQVLHNNL